MAMTFGLILPRMLLEHNLCVPKTSSGLIK
jgi:hypothetical protein